MTSNPSAVSTRHLSDIECKRQATFELAEISTLLALQTDSLREVIKLQAEQSLKGFVDDLNHKLNHSEWVNSALADTNRELNAKIASSEKELAESKEKQRQINRQLEGADGDLKQSIEEVHQKNQLLDTLKDKLMRDDEKVRDLTLKDQQLKALNDKFACKTRLFDDSKKEHDKQLKKLNTEFEQLGDRLNESRKNEKEMARRLKEVQDKLNLTEQRLTHFEQPNGQLVVVNSNLLQDRRTQLVDPRIRAKRPSSGVDCSIQENQSAKRPKILNVDSRTQTDIHDIFRKMKSMCMEFDHFRKEMKRISDGRPDDDKLRQIRDKTRDSSTRMFNQMVRFNIQKPLSCDQLLVVVPDMLTAFTQMYKAIFVQLLHVQNKMREDKQEKERLNGDVGTKHCGNEVIFNRIEGMKQQCQAQNTETINEEKIMLIDIPKELREVEMADSSTEHSFSVQNDTDARQKNDQSETDIHILKLQKIVNSLNDKLDQSDREKTDLKVEIDEKQRRYDELVQGQREKWEENFNIMEDLRRQLAESVCKQSNLERSLKNIREEEARIAYKNAYKELLTSGTFVNSLMLSHQPIQDKQLVTCSHSEES